ncbi:transglycosylase SLT domain-containing protein [Candidatus Fermentibacteria bacterium]|nr:transglycosylase SLT domain-containing protein [Candidatus Fermentibacteria bacterium]
MTPGLALALVLACAGKGPHGAGPPLTDDPSLPAANTQAGRLLRAAWSAAVSRAGRKAHFWILAPRLEDGIARRLCRRRADVVSLWQQRSIPDDSKERLPAGISLEALSHADDRRGDRFPFSPYDDIIRAAAARHDLDWLLLAALIFHESGFDPCRASSAGAVGLMQVMPATATELGIFDPWEPRQNIEAGARYFRRMYDSFHRLDEADRVACAVASYCAGLGHVLDACSLSAADGRDPARWAGNVEETMAMLTNPVYARRATHGGADGHQAVAFANMVLLRWQEYGAQQRLFGLGSRQ